MNFTWVASLPLTRFCSNYVGLWQKMSLAVELIGVIGVWLIQDVLPTSIIGASKIWHNISSVNLVLSGTILNLQCIADIESRKTKKGRADVTPPSNRAAVS
jgi:hypothetical protein